MVCFETCGNGLSIWSSLGFEFVGGAQTRWSRAWLQTRVAGIGGGIPESVNPDGADQRPRGQVADRATDTAIPVAVIAGETERPCVEGLTGTW